MSKKITLKDLKNFKVQLNPNIEWEMEIGNGYVCVSSPAGDKTYFINSDGDWEKREYDENGNQTYYEKSTGFWWKREYNKKGNETHYEDNKPAKLKN